MHAHWPWNGPFSSSSDISDTLPDTDDTGLHVCALPAVNSPFSTMALTLVVKISSLDCK